MTIETTNHQPPALLPDIAPAPRQDTDSWVQVMAQVVRLAEHVAPTDFVPRGLRGNVPATTAAMLYGREVGLPPMTALTSIHVVDGRPGMSAEAMRSLVYAAGHEIVFDESTGAICRMRARRRASNEWTSLSWTIDMARAAGLMGKDNWKKYPRDMLIARCTTALCRMVFPDVIHGFRSTEELGDMGDSAAPPEPPRRSRTTRRHNQPAVTPQPLTGAHSGPTGDDSGFATPDIPAALPDAPDAAPSAVATDDGAAASPAPPEFAPTPTGQRAGEASNPDNADDTEDDNFITKASLRMLRRQMRELGMFGMEDHERHALVSEIVGRDDVIESSTELTRDESARLITALSVTSNLAEVYSLLDAVRAGKPLPTPEDYAGYDDPDKA